MNATTTGTATSIATVATIAAGAAGLAAVSSGSRCSYHDGTDTNSSHIHRTRTSTKTSTSCFPSTARDFSTATARMMKALTAMLMLLFINPAQVMSLSLPVPLSAHSPADSAAPTHMPTSVPTSQELFSVAPMMGHTNRHYRYMFRCISQHAHLYTEMIPANQIVQAYQLAAAEHSSTGAVSYHPDDILEVVSSISSHSYTNADPQTVALHELLQFDDPHGNTHLQLGGKDPQALAKAASIGAAYGYDSINLNCGCPSNAVSGRAGGAALMQTPSLVAQCVEAMSRSIQDMVDASCEPNGTFLSVKHRLGVREIATYDAAADRAKSDDEAFQESHHFVSTITKNGDVRRVQCHARIALLGDALEQSSSLWVPSKNNANSKNGNNDSAPPKINHKRAQYQAKRRARQATIDNRSIPPLRPGVVPRLASHFPQLEVVTNGGIQNVNDIQQRTSGGTGMGAMVGRAVINHPCSFASVDDLWRVEGDDLLQQTQQRQVMKSRDDVLTQYMQYCAKEEERWKALQWTQDQMESNRRRLIGAPFHLMYGEDGNDAYQRRLRKLGSRAQRYTAQSMLQAAMMDVPSQTLTKSIREHTPISEIERYDFAKRSGPLQRSIF